MKNIHPDLSARLRSLTVDMRALDVDLKSDETPDVTLLQEFRSALDDVRLTAWTVSEVLTARQTGRNPEPVLSFLAAERLRRLARIMKDLSVDMDRQHFTWHTSGIQALSDSVILLQSKLTKLIAKHRQGIQKVSDAG
jgi:hypothetical protein